MWNLEENFFDPNTCKSRPKSRCMEKNTICFKDVKLFLAKIERKWKKVKNQ